MLVQKPTPTTTPPTKNLDAEITPTKSLDAEIILDPLKPYKSCIIGVGSSVINSPVNCTLFHLFITLFLFVQVTRATLGRRASTGWSRPWTVPLNFRNEIWRDLSSCQLITWSVCRVEEPLRFVSFFMTTFLYRG